MPDQITRARQRPRMKIVIGWWSTDVPQRSWPRSSGMPEVNVQSTSKTSSSWKTPMRSSRNTLPDQRVASVRACQLRTSNGSQCAGVRAAQFFFFTPEKAKINLVLFQMRCTLCRHETCCLDGYAFAGSRCVKASRCSCRHEWYPSPISAMLDLLGDVMVFPGLPCPCQTAEP